MAKNQNTRESNQPVVDTDKCGCKTDACIKSQVYGYEAKQWKQDGRDNHTSDSVHGEKEFPKCRVMIF